MLRCALLTLSLAVAIFLLSLLPSDADGCAAIGRAGEPPIRIAQESAIIIWDPVKKVEHFIRHATFDTKSPDFGFLVPTPTMPKLPLGEVGTTAFDVASFWTRPKIVTRTEYAFDPIFCCYGFSKRAMLSAPLGEGDSVRVLHEQKVGGYQAAVLEADNTEDLSKWLKDHGFSNDPELQSWLAPYVIEKWKITAFKITQDPKTGLSETTKPVRMSFATAMPFFPYREPEGKPVRKEIEPEKSKQVSQPAQTEVDGIWKVESAQGHDVAKLQGTRFRFVDGVAVGKYLKDTKYRTESAKDPKWLDVGNMPGIYRLDDDGESLHWCRGVTKRPGEFDCTKEGSLVVLRRDKKAEADDAAEKVKAEEWQRLHGGKRMLRVFFVSSQRMDAKLGNAAWHAKVPWADQLNDEQRQRLANEAGVPEDDVPATAWMTTFEDSASPRPGKEEVYFEPAKEQTPIHRPDWVRINEVWIPGDLVLLGLLFVGLVVVLTVRKCRRT